MSGRVIRLALGLALGYGLALASALVITPLLPYQPVLSFSADRGRAAQIYLMDVYRRLVFPLEGASEGLQAVHWLADGGQIHVVNDYDPTQKRFRRHILRRDGDAQQALFTDNGLLSAWELAAWSPDGAHLLLTVSEATDWAEIIRLDLPSGRIQQLTSNNFPDNEPDWSPNGQYIVYQALMADGWDIFVMSAEGQLLRRLTERPGLDALPRWSPDGEAIAFVSDRAGPRNIYLMSPWGEDVRRLTDGGIDSNPTWSPDGRWLAYVSLTEGTNWDIYWVDVVTGEQARLTTHPGADLNPAWRP